jgi:hypothetical protein
VIWNVPEQPNNPAPHTNQHPTHTFPQTKKPTVRTQTVRQTLNNSAHSRPAKTPPNKNTPTSQRSESPINTTQYNRYSPDQIQIPRACQTATPANTPAQQIIKTNHQHPANNQQTEHPSSDLTCPESHKSWQSAARPCLSSRTDARSTRAPSHAPLRSLLSDGASPAAHIGKLTDRLFGCQTSTPARGGQAQRPHESCTRATHDRRRTSPQHRGPRSLGW